MKIFAMEDSCGDFARAIRPGGMRFPLRPAATPPDVLDFEWEYGSDVIGDFTWVATVRVVVTERVRQSLSDNFTGFVFAPVEMRQDSKLKKPIGPNKRTRRRVWLPHEGPPLSELWVTHWVHADPERSSLRSEGLDPARDEQRYAVEGIEVARWRWDQVKQEMVRWRVPRAAGRGIFVDERALEGAAIFRLHEQPGLVLCTERMMRYIEQEGFTNVTFLEAGDTV